VNRFCMFVIISNSGPLGFLYIETFFFRECRSIVGEVVLLIVAIFTQHGVLQNVQTQVEFNC
jgi:ABC-type tungstate transport system substrate-binding protein